MQALIAAALISAAASAAPFQRPVSLRLAGTPPPETFVVEPVVVTVPPVRTEEKPPEPQKRQAVLTPEQRRDLQLWFLTAGDRSRTLRVDPELVRRR